MSKRKNYLLKSRQNGKTSLFLFSGGIIGLLGFFLFLALGYSYAQTVFFSFIGLPLLAYLLFRMLANPSFAWTDNTLRSGKTSLPLSLPQGIKLKDILSIHLMEYRYGPLKLEITYRKEVDEVAVRTFPYRGHSKNPFMDELDEVKFDKLYQELKRLGDFRGFSVSRTVKKKD